MLKTKIFIHGKACRKRRGRDRSGWHRKRVSAPQIMCREVILLSIYWKVVWFNFVAFRFLRCRWNCGSDLLHPLYVSPFLPRARTAKHYGQRRSYWPQHSIRFVLDAPLSFNCLVDSQAPYSSFWCVCAGCSIITILKIIRQIFLKLRSS